MKNGNSGQGGRGVRKPTRRAVLKVGGALGVASMLPITARRVEAVDVPSDISKFENELPKPLDESFLMNPNPSGKQYDVSMVETTHNFDPEGLNKQAKVFAYKDNNDTIGGTFPGKTFEVWSGESAAVKYTNELFGGHFLPIDTTVHGASDADSDAPRTVTHMHGGKTQPPSDGDPEDTRTPGKPQVMQYSNINPASTLWYHDHALGITRLNVYAGLAGFYIVRDEAEAALGLPSGEYEIPIVLQDRCFDESGELFYPYEGEDASEPEPQTIGEEDDPRVPLEFFGNVSVVNGLVWPKATVKRGLYRLRLLNGSNSRFYSLELQNETNDQGTPDIYQIGTDGGFLFEGPTKITERFVLAPGERMDLLVDFAGFEDDTEFLLHNNAGSPFKGHNYVDDDTDDALPEVMKFVVTGDNGNEATVPGSLPTSFPGLENLGPADTVNTRRLTLLEGTETIPNTDSNGPDVTRLQPLLGVLPSDLPANGTLDPSTLEGDHWDDPNTEDPKVNEAEVWELYNLSEDTHPVHLHIVQFRVLDRHELVENGGGFQLDEDGVPEWGNSKPVDDTEKGPKDTVQAHPEQVTRIVVPFDTFPGETVWHCHILEHEDNEMMRPMKVGGNAK